jgi:putative transposase
MMERFTKAGKANSNNDKIAHQKLDHIHYNPVEAGFVSIPEDYLYSTARDYYTSKKSLPDIIILESLDR